MQQHIGESVMHIWHCAITYGFSQKSQMPNVQECIRDSVMHIWHWVQCHLCVSHYRWCGIDCMIVSLKLPKHLRKILDAHLALLHIWHCEWHCVMSYYAILCLNA